MQPKSKKTKRLTKTEAKKQVKKPVTKKLSRSHKSAISEGRKNKWLTMAEDNKEKTLVALRAIARAPLSGRELADRLGMSHNTLYGSVLAQLGTSFQDLVKSAEFLAKEESVAFRSSLSRKATSPLYIGDVRMPWWYLPATGMETDGLQTPKAAMRQSSFKPHEAEMAAKLYWHDWAALRSPDQELGAGPHNQFFSKAVSHVFSVLATDPSSTMPSKEDLQRGSPTLIALGARLAGEILKYPYPRASSEEQADLTQEDLNRQKDAQTWLVKLIEEADSEVAASVLAECANAAMTFQARAACVTTSRMLLDRERAQRELTKEGKSRNPSVPVLSPRVVNVLIAGAYGAG